MYPQLNQRHLAHETQPEEHHERAVQHQTRRQLLPLCLRFQQPSNRNRLQQRIRRKTRNVDANARVERPHGEGVARAHKDDNQAHAAQRDGGKDADDALVQRALTACDRNFSHALALPRGGYSLTKAGRAGAGTTRRERIRVDGAATLLRCACKTVRSGRAAAA